MKLKCHQMIGHNIIQKKKGKGGTAKVFLVKKKDDNEQYIVNSQKRRWKKYKIL